MLKEMKILFCIVGEGEIIPVKFDTIYKSVILFGKAEEVNDQEKHMDLMELIKKYSHDY